MVKSAIGIYIAQDKVSMVTLKMGLGGSRVAEFNEVKIDIKEKDKTAKIINELLRTMGIQNKEVFVSFPTKETMIRFLELPRLPKVEQETAIKSESQKLIPFKQEDLVYDFELKGSPDKKIEVVFVAAKKEALKDYVDILEQSGLKIKILEPASFSLIRALKANGQIKKGRITAIITIAQNEGNINIVKDGFPRLTRDFSYTSQLQSINDIEKKSPLQNLISELFISFSYFKRQFPQETIEEILLSGDIDLKNWDESLSKELGIPVALVRPWEAGKGRFLSSAGLSIAVGSGLKGLIRAFPQINLYEKKEEPSLVKEKPSLIQEKLSLAKETKELLKVASVAASVSCSLLIGFYLIMAGKVATIKSKLANLKSQLRQSSLVNSSMSCTEIETVKTDLGQKLSTFQKLIDERPYLVARFNELPQILPDGLWLTGLSSEEKVTEEGRRSSCSFKLRGAVFLGDSAREIEAINNFVYKLNESQFFSKDFDRIKLDSVTRDRVMDSAVSTFEITAFKE